MLTYTIKHNAHNKRYIVFKVEGTGFGSYRIEKSCKTRKEAEAYIASK